MKFLTTFVLVTIMIAVTALVIYYSKQHSQTGVLIERPDARVK